ncbi:MAG: pitrilysin family protein, partial [Bacteroidota bacterium]
MLPKSTHFLFLFLLLSFSNLSAQDSSRGEKDPFQVISYTLDNGLTVILNEDHHQPQIFGGVAVNAGGKQDPADATGMAHYLEHMLFKGTRELGTSNFEAEKPHLDSILILYDQLALVNSEEARKALQQKINYHSTEAAQYSLANEFDNLLKSIGSTGVNAFTNEEMTFYHNSFPPNQVEKWLDVYAHRFQQPVFRTFQSELEVVYEEKNRSMDNFGTALIEKFNQQFFKNHPYGQQTVIGTVEHLKRPSLRKMYEYFNTYYVANNMALILCGDFDSDEVKPLIEKTFGALPKKDIPPYPDYPELPFAGAELIKMKAAPVKLGAVGYRTVPKGHPDEVGLEVCNYLLFNESETGLLNQLVLDNKIMFAGSFPQVYKDHGGQIVFYVLKILGQSHKKGEELVFAQIDRLAQGTFSDDLLAAAKNEMIVDHEKRLEKLDDRGVALGEAF